MSESEGRKVDEPRRELSKKRYEKELRRLEVELVRLQAWVKREKAKVAVIFEGRDGAGKGGVIKRITERVSPRVFRVVALPKPTDRERTQLYMQRYVAQLPAGGEVVLFDRSWYNRAGVEKVMGFCTRGEYERFLRSVSRFEKGLVEEGLILRKYWLTVSYDVQRWRFQDRIDDPRKHWKLSPMDLEALSRWYEYSRARDAMFQVSDTPHAPWNLVRADDKRSARLNCISHLLASIPYESVDREMPELPDREDDEAYDEEEALRGRTFVPEIF